MTIAFEQWVFLQKSLDSSSKLRKFYSDNLQIKVKNLQFVRINSDIMWVIPFQVVVNVQTVTTLL